MKRLRRSLLLGVSLPLLALAAGCTGADNPVIPDIVAPVQTPEQVQAANTNMPKDRYMENDKYKEGMEKMRKAAGGN